MRKKSGKRHSIKNNFTGLTCGGMMETRFVMQKTSVMTLYHKIIVSSSVFSALTNGNTCSPRDSGHVDSLPYTKTGNWQVCKSFTTSSSY